jgi:hypothetical protein
MADDLAMIFCHDKKMRQELVVQSIVGTSLLLPLAQLIAAFAEPDFLDWCTILLAKPLELKTRFATLTVRLPRLERLMSR